VIAESAEGEEGDAHRVLLSVNCCWVGRMRAAFGAQRSAFREPRASREPRVSKSRPGPA
jgi:hypothetical protein